MSDQTLIEEQQAMVADCETRQSKLNDWEVLFLDSIDIRLSRGITLTPKQEESLEKIWEKATKEG